MEWQWAPPEWSSTPLLLSISSASRNSAARLHRAYLMGTSDSLRSLEPSPATPKLLLLDEPGAGLNTVEKNELVQLLKRLKGHGLTILVIDHDMNLVEQVADRITVLNFGRRIADGPPAELLRNPEVMAAYLGKVKTHVAP